jgi:uncharacterized protein (TIGR00730 family)
MTACFVPLKPILLSRFALRFALGFIPRFNLHFIPVYVSISLLTASTLLVAYPASALAASTKVTPRLKDIGEEASTAHKARASWQMFSLMAEFVEATEYLSGLGPAVSVYGSARIPPGSPYYVLSETIGRKLSDAGFAVITGGGPGVMKAANKGAHAGKSLSIGLAIDLPHEKTSSRHHAQYHAQYHDISLRFRHFFARKVALVKHADAVVVMPGGIGTLDELAEVMTLMQTNKSRRVPVILVGGEFWGGLLTWFKHDLLPRKLIAGRDLDGLRVIDNPDEVVRTIKAFYQGLDKVVPAEAPDNQIADDQLFHS